MKSYILYSTVILLLLSCGEKAVDSEPKQQQAEALIQFTDAQIKQLELKFEKPKERSLTSTLKLNGKVDVPPQNLISVCVPMSGYLKKSDLLPGMKVKKGAVIAWMEDQQYIQLQEEYLISKSELSFAEAEFKRQKTLNQSKSISDKLLQQSELEYQRAKIKSKSLAEKLRLINLKPESINENSISRSVPIYSPIDGFVSKVNVNVGKYVASNDILFELINPSDIHLNLTVFEKDLRSLKIGQNLKAYTNSNPELTYLCKIILISQNIREDRSVEVHCHFEQYDETLFPGMYMNADLQVNNHVVNSISEQAIVFFEGKNYVFVHRGNKRFEMLEVQKGKTHDGYVEIYSLDGSDFGKRELVSQGAYAVLMAFKNTEEEE